MLKQSSANKFPTELKNLKYKIRDHAKEYGLDFYEVIFEILDYKEISEIASYSGFPQRYPHWTFGMQFEELSKSYTYGLSKIYEMVINNDPCYAYLLKCNNLVDQKIVMAHVYGHCDFFKNNLYFSHTNRKMMDEMANHSSRILKYVDRYGIQAVEAFMDCCFSLENLIDANSTFIKRRDGYHKEPGIQCTIPETNTGVVFHQGELVDLFADNEDEERTPEHRLKSKGYMERYINPPEFLESRTKEAQDKKREKKKFPESPEADILLFLIENAPLRNWQRDILSIMREEAYYFLPQVQTKIMNEGWATYWHSRIMTEKVLKDSELIDYADHHSGTLGGSKTHLNPYKLGVELYRDIEERWDKGRFGKEYDDCEDLKERDRWDKKLGLGRKKIFEVRKLYNDLNFLDTFLTADFCRKQKIFVFGKSEMYSDGRYIIQNREFEKIKKLLLDSLTNRGQPIIRIEDANYENRGELLLAHEYEGRDLKLDYARDTLLNLHRLWKRPVHVNTVFEEEKVILTFDGRDFTSEEIE